LIVACVGDTNVFTAAELIEFTGINIAQSPGMFSYSYLITYSPYRNICQMTVVALSEFSVLCSVPIFGTLNRFKGN
jgi:hypothetical protein